MSGNEFETDSKPQASQLKQGCAKQQWVQPELHRFSAGEAESGGASSVDGVSLS